MRSALLIIDMQNDYFRSDRLETLKESLVRNCKELATIARSKNMPVIWIRQEMNADMSNASIGDRKAGTPFVVTGTTGAQLVDGLEKLENDHEIIKTRFSPFYKTELESLLQKLGTDTLVLAGINSHACVRMAAIDGYERDYEVILATDCIQSYDEEHHRISMQYLTQRIARPMSNKEITLLD